MRYLLPGSLRNSDLRSEAPSQARVGSRTANEDDCDLRTQPQHSRRLHGVHDLPGGVLEARQNPNPALRLALLPCQVYQTVASQKPAVPCMPQGSFARRDEGLAKQGSK